MTNTTVANNLYPIANGTSSSNPFVDQYLVIYDKDNLPYSIKYHEMPALLLVEIKNLKSEIEELKKIIIKNDQYYNR